MRKLNLIGGLLAILPVVAAGEGNGFEPAAMSAVVEMADATLETSINLRTVFNATKLADFKDLAYSSIGWVRDDAGVTDERRTAEVVATKGELRNGVFIPDLQDGERVLITVLAPTAGQGVFDWSMQAKAIYELRHMVKEDGDVVEAETLVGYLDNRDYTIIPSDSQSMLDDASIAHTSAEEVREKVRIDLREGVRTEKHLSDVLPFEYSSTNWIGDVIGVGIDSVARVTMVELEGVDEDVMQWVEKAGTMRQLVRTAGEGSVRWVPRNGVWKAVFDILNGDSSVHQETAYFDLRDASGLGTLIIVR